MLRISLTLLVFLLLLPSAEAGGLRTPEDVRKNLTLTASDYVADMADWRPLNGKSLSDFVGHGVWGGLYFEKDPILDQESGQAFIIRVSGDDFSSQGEKESLPDRGELSVEDDRYCVYWRRYGQLCYRVLFREINGKSAYLITREDGKVAAGVELLEK